MKTLNFFVRMPPDIRPLCTALQVVARDECRENPDKIEEALAELREWIEQTPHLKARTDDQFLVAFLRGCKYKMEKVKQKLDMFYTLRTHIPELMLGRDPLDPKIRTIIKLGYDLEHELSSINYSNVFFFKDWASFAEH